MARGNPVILAARSFPSQGAATAFFKEMLSRYRAGDRISDVDALDLAALLERHDEFAQKVGCGTDHFSVMMTEHDTPCFRIERKDGTGTDFSYLHLHHAATAVAETGGISGISPRCTLRSLQCPRQFFCPTQRYRRHRRLCGHRRANFARTRPHGPSSANDLRGHRHDVPGGPRTDRERRAHHDRNKMSRWHQTSPTRHSARISATTTRKWRPST